MLRYPKREDKEKTVEMSVKYRFKSSIEYSTVFFPGNYISVGDLRKEITKQKRLAANADYELQIMNAETKHVYEFDPTLIPANTNLIVSRVPATEKTHKNSTEVAKAANIQQSANNFAAASSKSYTHSNISNYSNAIPHYQYSEDQYTNNYENYENDGYYNDYENGYYHEQNSHVPTDNSKSTSSEDAKGELNPNLQYISVTPANKPQLAPYYYYTRRSSAESGEGAVIEMVDKDGCKTSPSQGLFGNKLIGNPGEDVHVNKLTRRTRSDSESAVPPPGSSYKCFKCNVQGHWIKNCPLLNESRELKRSTGIPRSHMVIVDEPVEGSYITPEGRYAVPRPDFDAKRLS